MDERIDKIADDVSYMRGKFESHVESIGSVLSRLSDGQTDHSHKIRKLEDWNLFTKVAAFTGASGGAAGLWSAVKAVAAVASTGLPH